MSLDDVVGKTIKQRITYAGKPIVKVLQNTTKHSYIFVTEEGEKIEVDVQLLAQMKSQAYFNINEKGEAEPTNRTMGKKSTLPVKSTVRNVFN